MQDGAASRPSFLRLSSLLGAVSSPCRLTTSPRAPGHQVSELTLPSVGRPAVAELPRLHRHPILPTSHHPTDPAAAMSVPADARPGSPEPTVDDLTNWFLAAKRSLSSVTLCQQANILVDTAKAAIQEAAAISARCVFLRNSLQDQLNIAGQVSRMVQSRQDQLRGEFQVR